MKSAPGKYERIGEQKGPLNLGGARAKMKENPDIVYVPHHSVVGSKKEIVSWLKENHPEDNVKEVLASSYSADTLKDDEVLEAFEQEILLAREDREKARDHRDQLRTMNLDFLGSFIQSFEQERRDMPRAERDGHTTSKVSTTLKDRVKALMEEGEDKVLDVTNMKKKGDGAKKSSFKDGGSRKRLAQSAGVPFFHVAYSTNSKSAADGVRNFLKFYGKFDNEKISHIVEQVKAGSDINIGHAKSPNRTNLLTPTRRSRGRGRKQAVDDDLLED
jgi:hypothetical protein